MSFQERLDAFLAEVVVEVGKAREKHPPMASAHEGRSVIREECDELFEHVRADTGDGLDARKEAKQVAAMGIRYAVDVCGWTLQDAESRVRLRAFGGAVLASPHEGHSYMIDHFAALFSLVASGSGREMKAASSALDLSAAAIRYAVDLCAAPAKEYGGGMTGDFL